MSHDYHDPLPDHRLSLSRIIEAAGAIDPVFVRSPQYRSESLSAAVGCDLVLKVETANPIRSFKGRGADYFLRKITERRDTRQLVCASTGNFGQAMAFAGRAHDRSVVVYSDTSANPLKLERIRSFGAEVRQVGTDFDAAKEAAREFCEGSGAWMIEDGREPEISEGAGTIGVELLERDVFDTIVVPVGNGALINGVARWFKAAAPAVTVVGVSARGADAMERSWRSKSLVERPRAMTIAEGIAVRVPVPEAVDDMASLVDEMVLVDDPGMVDAMRLIHSETGLVVEPAGAVGVAAVMSDTDRYSSQRVATILTGSNVSPKQMREWLN